jgi:hypothetical protein
MVGLRLYTSRLKKMNEEADFPVWDEYAHVYIMGIKERALGLTISEFENPKLQRIYNYGRGLGNPPPYDSNKHTTP